MTIDEELLLYWKYGTQEEQNLMKSMGIYPKENDNL